MFTLPPQKKKKNRKKHPFYGGCLRSGFLRSPESSPGATQPSLGPGLPVRDKRGTNRAPGRARGLCSPPPPSGTGEFLRAPYPVPLVKFIYLNHLVIM